MKLINRNELENRLTCLFENLNLDAYIQEEIFNEIEDMPYLDTIKLTNGNLRGHWCK